MFRGLFHKPIFQDPYKATRIFHGMSCIMGFDYCSSELEDISDITANKFKKVVSKKPGFLNKK